MGGILDQEVFTNQFPSIATNLPTKTADPTVNAANTATNNHNSTRQGKQHYDQCVIRAEER